MKKSTRIRMIDWAVVSVVAAIVIALLAPQQLPVALYKLFLVASAAVAGYWIDRSLFPYARPDSDFCMPGVETAGAMVRRAIIVGSAMLAVGLGA